MSYNLCFMNYDNAEIYDLWKLGICELNREVVMSLDREFWKIIQEKIHT